LLGWQVGQSPRTRAMQVQQILNAGLPSTFLGTTINAGAQDAATVGTSTFPFIVNIAPITGQFPSNSAPALNQINCYNDTADGSLVGDEPSCLRVTYSTNDGAKMPRIAISANSGINAGTGLAVGGVPFLGAVEWRADAEGPMGSTSSLAPIGQVTTTASYALAGWGAGALAQVQTEESDFQVQYGAFAVSEGGKIFIQLSQDFGTVGYADGQSGRFGLVVGAQGAGCDLHSSATALVSCGQYLPAWDQIFRINAGNGGQSIMDSNTIVMTPIYQSVGNTNSCTDCGAGATGSPPHGGAAIAAPIIKPMRVGSIIDFHNTNVLTNAWWTNGFRVDGTGDVYVGGAAIKPHVSGYGLQIDSVGKYASTVAVNAYRIKKQIGEQVFDNFGGIYQVATLDGSGNVQTVTTVVPSYSSSATPSCTTACYAYGSGAPMLLDYTWTAEPGIGIGMNSGAVYMPWTVITTSGGIQFSANVACATCDFAAGSGHGIFLQDTAGHNVTLATISDVTQFKGFDSTGAASAVFSYLNNQSTLQPFVISKPLAITSYVQHSGTNPGTPATCGTAPSMVASSTDVVGIVSVGTGTATACTIVFATTHAITPTCIANAHIAGVPVLVSVTNETTGGFTVSAGATNMATAAIRYVCM